MQPLKSFLYDYSQTIIIILRPLEASRNRPTNSLVEKLTHETAQVNDQEQIYLKELTNTSQIRSMPRFFKRALLFVAIERNIIFKQREKMVYFQQRRICNIAKQTTQCFFFFFACIFLNSPSWVPSPPRIALVLCCRSKSLKKTLGIQLRAN